MILNWRQFPLNVDHHSKLEDKLKSYFTFLIIIFEVLIQIEKIIFSIKINFRNLNIGKNINFRNFRSKISLNY